MKYHLFTLFVVLFGIAQLGIGQVVINEACSDNNTIIEDNHGDTPDWIELYNTGDTPVNLSGYYLSDDTDDPQKWSFPAVQIAGHGFLLIFASGTNEVGDFIHCDFKLSKYGETLQFSKPTGELLEVFELPALSEDESYGRQEDGEGQFYYFPEPTPLASNNNSVVRQKVPSPVFSQEDRFFDTPVTLVLSDALPDSEIRYTTDGSIPDENALLYQSPIALDSTMCIRAISFAEGYLPSDIITQTYFINTHHVLPVVALSSHPDNFWGWEEGILIDGPNISSEWPFYGANYWLDIEVPIHFEYFDESKKFQVGYDLGLKIHGGRGGRVHPQKPMRLMAKKRYGTEVMDFPFFEDRENTKYKRLILRNSSGDFNVAHFRDGMLQRLYIREGLDIDGLAYRPVVVYIDGRYYGVMNLREKADEYYLKYRFGADVKHLDLLEEDTMVVVGDFDVFNQHYDFVIGNDMSIEANYQQAASFFDIKSMVDYYIGETAVCNTDSYANNIKYWRERKEGSKWRYILFDLDSALGRNGWTNAKVDVFGDKMVTYQDTNRHINIFKSLLQNEDFKFYFLNRYADLLNTTFREEHLRDEIIYSRDLIADEMVQHFMLYTWPGFDIWWNDRMNGLFEFAEERPTYARQYLQEYFQLPGQVRLKLKTYPEDAGVIQINTIQPDLPWDGIYFNGVPVNLTIVPNSGFHFSHWQSLHTIKDKDTNLSIQYNFEQDDEIVAFFDTPYSGLDILSFPGILKSGNEVLLIYTLDDITEVSFNLMDASGKMVQKWSARKQAAGKNKTTLTIKEDLPKGVYFLWVNAGETQGAQRLFIY